jgi:sugar O-acyltransferase (sialic acid O-acetyltransferase NeuD family)
MNRNLIVFGVGGHSKVVIDVANLVGCSISNFFDDNPLTHNIEFNGVKVLGPIINFISGNAFVAIGENKKRKLIVEKVSNVSWQTLIHPSAIISKNVYIEEGSIIMAGAVIQPGTRIGKHCVINTGACIDHDCIIGDFVHIAPNATLAGGVIVGEGTLIGIGSSIIPNKTIGRWTNVGAGSLVINDQPDNCTTFGVPAKLIKFNNE